MIKYASDKNIAEIKGSTNYDGTNMSKINDISSWLSASNSYKYIEIDHIADYFLRYDATNGAMYKGDSANTVTDAELEQLGLGIDSSSKKLILKGVNFQTSADRALMLQGQTTIELQDGTTNAIDVYYDSGVADESYYGIVAGDGLTITGTGTLTINEKSAKNSIKADNMNEYGIYCIAGEIYDGTKGTLDILNGTIKIRGKDKICYGIYAEKRINIDACTLDISSDKGYGIYVDSGKNLSISNSEGTIKGYNGAILSDDTAKCYIQGKIDASSSYDGELTTVIDIDSNYKSYKQVKISKAVISVDITWGSMDFKYTEGAWDADNHAYNVGSWSPNDTSGEDNNRIKVTNNSNIPIKSTITYTPAETYTGITGTIVNSKGNAIAPPLLVTTSSPDKVLDVYLKLTGKLPSNTVEGTPIGQVTVSITE